MVTAEDFRNALIQIFQESQQKRVAFIDVRSGDLHESVGEYPGPHHQLDVCCTVMWSFLDSEDKIITSSPLGDGANLVIRYHIPRN
jgi:5-methylcytosine-specific restriction protein A